jgi:hypothetical protein
MTCKKELQMHKQLHSEKRKERERDHFRELGYKGAQHCDFTTEIRTSGARRGRQSNGAINTFPW